MGTAGVGATPGSTRPTPNPSPEGEGLSVRLAAAFRALADVSDTPRLDAELLMAHALGMTREALLLGRDRAVPPAFADLLARRLRHEPIAYITGRRAFWTIELAVTPAVLIPRPDSETLIEAAVAQFGAAGPGTVLDLGTGSGALLLAALAEWPGAAGVGVDRSEAALAVAAANAARLGLARRARFRIGDWDGDGGRHALILCNPPYVADGAALAPGLAFEPAGALFAGADGLDAYRRLVPLLGGQLAVGGIACLELGAGQAEAVAALCREAGLETRRRRDLGGHERCLIVSA